MTGAQAPLPFRFRHSPPLASTSLLGRRIASQPTRHVYSTCYAHSSASCSGPSALIAVRCMGRPLLPGLARATPCSSTRLVFDIRTSGLAHDAYRRLVFFSRCFACTKATEHVPLVYTLLGTCLQKEMRSCPVFVIVCYTLEGFLSRFTRIVWVKCRIFGVLSSQAGIPRRYGEWTGHVHTFASPHCSY